MLGHLYECNGIFKEIKDLVFILPSSAQLSLSYIITVSQPATSNQQPATQPSEYQDWLALIRFKLQPFFGNSILS